MVNRPRGNNFISKHNRQITVFRLRTCYAESKSKYHDDVIKWKHFPRYWPFVRGIHRGPVNSPHKGQWRGTLMFSLICVWINGLVNNCKAGDLRRYRAHYDVTVMHWQYFMHQAYLGRSSESPILPQLNCVDPMGPVVNILRPRRNEQHFADDIFKRIFFNENVWISIKISLKFVPKGPINNIPALVQIMAWRRSGDKPLSEPMMVSLPTHICVTRSQWINISVEQDFFLFCQKNIFLSLNQ